MDEGREKLIEEIGETALRYGMEYIGWSQFVLAALQKKLNLEDAGALKAAKIAASIILDLKVSSQCDNQICQPISEQ